MTDQAAFGKQGLLASLTALAATLVAIAHTRLDMLATDLEEDRLHLLSLLVMALLALFCLGVGMLLATLLLVVAFWDTHRLLMLGSLAGFFLVAGMAACSFAVYKVRTKPKVFAASLLELIKDRQQLTSRS